MNAGLGWLQNNWVFLVLALTLFVLWQLWKINKHVKILHEEAVELNKSVKILQENTPYCLSCNFKNLCPRR